MFDIGWSELLVIGVVALIVVGPKDLPVMFRTLGRMTGKARSMAREFSRAMDDAARESGVNDISRDLKAATSKKALGLDALEKAADKFEKWDPKLPGSQQQARPGAAKPAAAAVGPGEPKAMGPATQALADDRAAAAAARAADAPAAPVALPDPASPSPADAAASASVGRSAASPASASAEPAAPAKSAAVKRIPKTRSHPEPAAPLEKPAKAPKAAKPKPAAAADAPKRKRAKTDKGEA